MAVAGLDDARAQSMYFALTRAASEPDEGAIALRWLRALQTVQVANMRMMAELETIESNLRFWTHRLEVGHHFWFSLVRFGPRGFFGQLGRILGMRRSTEDDTQRRESEVEVTEKRVLILRVLHAQLCEALASVQRAGSLLYLGSESDGVVGEVEQEGNLLQVTDVAVRESMKALLSAFLLLRQACDVTLEYQQGSRGPVSRDRPLLSQALHRVLGVTQLHHIWSHIDLRGNNQLSSGPQNSEDRSDEARGAHRCEFDSRLSEEFIKSLQDTTAAIDVAQDVVGFASSLSSSSATVHDSLDEAHRAAFSLQNTSRLLDLPRWIAMPTQLQQHWILYAAAGSAATYVVVFVFKHSRLNGSHDLENWIKSGIDTVYNIWTERVAEPLQKVRGELFDTFRRRPSIVSMQDWEADRESLQRMLNEFKLDYSKKRRDIPTKHLDGSPSEQTPIESRLALSDQKTPTSGNGGGSESKMAGSSQWTDAEMLEGMQLMMNTYEKELKKPIRHLLAGSLMRSLLIQVQKLKLDTESAMLEIDQILRANELNISLVAAVPAFLIAGSALVGFGRLLAPSPPDPRREALPARIAMIGAERALEELERVEIVAKNRPKEDGASSINEARGLIAFRLAQAYAEAEALFDAHRGVLYTSTRGEWEQLRADLMSLSIPGPVAEKIRKCARMRSTYSIYQQF